MFEENITREYSPLIWILPSVQMSFPGSVLCVLRISNKKQYNFLKILFKIPTSKAEQVLYLFCKFDEGNVIIIWVETIALMNKLLADGKLFPKEGLSGYSLFTELYISKILVLCHLLASPLISRLWSPMNTFWTWKGEGIHV